MLHDPGTTPPTLPPDRPMNPWRAAVLGFFGGLGIVLALVGLGLPLTGAPRFGSPSIVVTSDSPTASRTPTSVHLAPSTYPPELLLAARAISTFMAPTPTETPQPPRATPTPIRTMICPDNPYVLPQGTICVGAEPLPTQTPIPTYPSCFTPPQEGITCQVRYGRADAPTPTPLAMILTLTPLPVMYQPGPH